jgi:hypothetical protein
VAGNLFAETMCFINCRVQFFLGYILPVIGELDKVSACADLLTHGATKTRETIGLTSNPSGCDNVRRSV